MTLSPSVNVAVRGYYGEMNFGDDVLMMACLKVLQQVFRPEEIGFFCADASYLHNLDPSLRAVSEFRLIGQNIPLLLYGGGTQFYSFPGGGRTSDPIDRLKRVVKSPKRLVTYTRRQAQSVAAAATVASIRYRRKAAIGIGAGPFVQGSPQEVQARALFPEMDYVAVRDEASFFLLRAWGTRSLFRGADLCYWDGLPDLRNPFPGKAPAGIGRVGIVIRDWYSAEGEIPFLAQQLAETVAPLRARGVEVTYILFCVTADRRWARYLHQQGEPFLAWQPSWMTPNDFLRELSRFDAFVTARYHGAVMASLLAKPVVCIEIEPKLRLIAEQLNLERYLWHPPFNPRNCLSVLEELEKGYAAAVVSAVQGAERMKVLAGEMVEKFTEFATGITREG